MTLSQIAGLGRKLAAFLGLFADCFGRREPRELLRVYVQGQLSGVHRKTAEGIALEFGKAPRDFHGWVQKPTILRSGPKKSKKGGGRKKYPRLARRGPSCEVQNLGRYSPVFQEQSWQRYRIKDTDKGPEVWEVKWAEFWRKGEDGLPGRRHCLIVARNVLTQEVKYFVANRVPGEKGVTLRGLLRVAFGRWTVERCFRVAKDELGMDHYQVRGWRCLHRHFYLTQASYLFCARIRQQYDTPGSQGANRLTIEQVRSAMNIWLSAADLKPAARRKRHEKDEEKQRYHQRRNLQAGKSHTKTKIARLTAMGIDVDRIKSSLQLHNAVAF
jgi:hypothetical protein